MFGREFVLLTYRHNWGDDRVVYYNDDGVLASLPAAWTSAVADDPFVVVSAGRSHFQVADLCALADILRGLAP